MTLPAPGGADLRGLGLETLALSNLRDFLDGDLIYNPNVMVLV